MTNPTPTDVATLDGTEVLEVVGLDGAGRPAATTEKTTTQAIANLAPSVSTLAGVTPGTAAASKAVILDGAKAISGLGAVAAASLTVTGITTLASADMQALSSTSIATLSGATLTGLSVAGSANMTALTTTSLHALASATTSSLTTTQVAALTSTQLGGLTTTNISALSALFLVKT